MKKLFFLLLVYGLVTFHASAQTHFITAGQTQGMIFTDCVPDMYVERQPYSGSPLSASDSGNTYIDINRDGADDFRIYRSSHNSSGNSSLEYIIFPLNQNCMVAKLDTFYSSMDGHPTTSILTIMKRFLINDTSILSGNLQWVNTYNTIIYSTYTNISPAHGGGGTVTDTDLQPDNVPYYYFLKVITNTDTLLGYLHFTLNGAEILDFACEGPTSSYIITSTNNLPPSNISISPNPFNNQINIGTDKAVEYQLTDYTGRVLLSGKTERSISTEMLPPGSYLLLIKNEELYNVKKILL